MADKTVRNDIERSIQKQRDDFEAHKYQDLGTVAGYFGGGLLGAALGKRAGRNRGLLDESGKIFGGGVLGGGAGMYAGTKIGKAYDDRRNARKVKK
jgi:hypothetical protein